MRGRGATPRARQRRSLLSRSFHFLLPHSNSATMSGLSLWLSPSNGSPLDSFLARLSSTLQSPAFQAHATLVSDEIVPAGLEADEVVKRVKEGVQQWQAAVELTELQLSFKDVRQGEQLRRTLTARLKELTLTGMQQVRAITNVF